MTADSIVQVFVNSTWQVQRLIPESVYFLLSLDLFVSDYFNVFERFDQKNENSPNYTIDGVLYLQLRKNVPIDSLSILLIIIFPVNYLGVVLSQTRKKWCCS